MSNTSATGLRILFVGDTSFGENYHAQAAQKGRANRLETRGYERMLAGVSDLLASADFVVANLETPLIRPTQPSPFAGRKKHIHWADPRRTAAVLRRHGVGAVSLGNNHVCDQGAGGLRSTLDALGHAGIDAFGAGFHASEAAAPFCGSFALGDVDLHLAVLGGKQRRRAVGSDIQPYAGAAPGVHAWSRGTDAARVHAMREADPGRIIVAFPHWGRNYEWREERQTQLAQTLIDAGADVVLGHGSHMMGEIERYRGRSIVYSIGNFVFGSPGRYRAFDGAVPFSFAACLDAQRLGSGGDITLSLRLYPICTDNRVTDYQPRLVTADEMDLVLRTLRERGSDAELEAWTVAEDHIGLCLESPLASVTGLVSSRTPTRVVPAGAMSIGL